MKIGESPLTKKRVSIMERAGIFLTFTALSFILIFVDSLGIFRIVYSGVGYVSTPMQYYINESRNFLEDFLYTFSNIGNLRDEINNLKVENSELQSQISQMEMYKSEAEELRNQLDLPEIEGYDLVDANIIGGDPSGVTSIVRIDKGAKGGLEEGMPVVYRNILIGRIERAFHTTSVVTLLTDSESNVPVINQRSRHHGLVHGDLGGLIMEDILQKEDVKEGDYILTLGDRYPGQLLIGTVKEVISTETSSKKSARVDPAIDYGDLEKVFIITNFDTDNNLAE